MRLVTCARTFAFITGIASLQLCESKPLLEGMAWKNPPSR
ncbi:hypothetical protein HY17_11120 [Hyphomonas sp. CY54-11-8]|nr:hypothetical protein HY17_11120 [Hyphomonas sp. CY54-11-8]